ncbi:alpha-amylase family glycosyl hydrolase [Hyphococcus sp. DH-69]|uniref:alpha-amylase family glycosyl hydrolase n=1 Tax=Hyphococcus formosus TaxID=3143534 RepID=UPI00398B1112
MSQRNKSTDHNWPQGAVIYQIYPRSFMDTNDDGVGDLKGIVSKLDYIRELGVDGIWLSPFFKSPMKDYGYDVADYCQVDPLFGTLDDFDRLIKEAHARDIKVIIDQVYSHTSDKHQWFQESRSDKSNSKSDWYVWADPKPDGSPPTNWQSVFTGPAWTWDARRGQYYLHNFLDSQPDLNLHNPDVQSALLNVARFWLDRGVDGFRLDAINFAMHDPELRDNPPSNMTNPKRPFDFQNHLYNQSHSEIPKFLRKLRAVTKEYGDIFTVAEVVGPDPVAEMKAFTAGDQHLTTAYNFDFLYADEINSHIVKSALAEWLDEKSSALPSWAFSNHDTPRVASRWSRTDSSNAAKLYLLLLFSLRGYIFLYQGEELGLSQTNVPFEELKDPEAIANWPHTLGRDGARTPIPWEHSTANFGFSNKKPWLPFGSDHKNCAVDIQESDEESVLNFTRALIKFRNNSPAFLRGSLSFVDCPPELLAFTRTLGRKKYLCLFNFGLTPAEWHPTAQGKVVLSTSASLNPPPAKIPPGQGFILSLSG